MRITITSITSSTLTYPDGGIFTHEDCEQAGLSPNPEWEEIESGKTHLDPAILKNLLERDLDEEQRRELEKELPKSEAFYERQAEWDRDFKVFLDVHRNRLFLALNEGRVAAVGKKLPQRSLVLSSDDPEWLWWQKAPWEAIPPTFWISFEIDWDMSRAVGRGGAYSFILIPTADLIKEFPLPDGQAVRDVVRMGDNLFLNSNTTLITAISKRGRPPIINWDDFHLEMAKRVKRDDLPEKQEAFIFEMQGWCKNRFGVAVQRGALLGRIKPYYDTFVRSTVRK